MQILDSPHDFGIEIRHSLGRIVLRTVKPDLSGEHMAGIESRIRSQNVAERLSEQSCSGEQHKCEPNFRYHQSTAEKSRTFAGTHATRTFFERLVEIAINGTKTGRQAKRQAGEQGQAKGKTESVEIEPNVSNAGKITRAERENHLWPQTRDSTTWQRTER